MQPLNANDPHAVGEFRLCARLGLGGMGRVYLGYSPAGRAVAVKICHPDLAADPAFVRRFAQEVTAAQAVNGLFTAQVVAAGMYGDSPWLATAYVPGPSLYDYVTGYGPLAEPTVWRLAAGLAEALQAVHAAGLVHRDLKPTNVLLATDGPRVIDFGIARALDAASMTTTGTTFGTPSYMSPEQAEGMQAGPASDVFALGCTLMFAATGDVPFGDGDAPGVLYRVVHAAPTLGSVPRRLRDLVAACLVKDPEGRPTLLQLLHACQDSAARSGWSAASFWPGEVTAVIAGYEARLAGTSPPPYQRPPSVQAPPSRQGPATHQPMAGPDGTTAVGVGRRRVLAGVGGTAAAGALAAVGWRLARSGTGRASASIRTPADRRAAWVHRTGGQVRSGAAVSGGMVYIGSDDGAVYALEAASGRLARTFRTAGAVSGGVTFDAGTVFAGSADGGVHAFSAADGGVSWTHRTGGAVRSTPAVADGVVYAGSDDHYVYALHAATGRRKWRTPTGGPVRSGPRQAGQLPADGVVWAGSADGHMYALHAATGRVAWRFAAGGAVYSGPVPVGDVGVDFGSDNGRLYSLTYDPFANSRHLTWNFAAGGAVRGTPVYTGETVYVGSADSKVYAVGLGNGQPIWSYPTGGPVYSGPAVHGTVLYVGSDDGYLYAIDVTTGTPRWRYRTGGPIRSQILVAGGLVYFGSLDHHVYALHA